MALMVEAVVAQVKEAINQLLIQEVIQLQAKEIEEAILLFQTLCLLILVQVAVVEQVLSDQMLLMALEEMAEVE
jgi:transposase